MRRRVDLALVLCFVFFTFTSPAAGQSLEATDPVEIERAITAAARPGDRALATQLAARIDAGLPAPLLSRAIESLVQNGSPPAVSALLTLARHRRAAVRAQVARGLVRSRSANARGALADLLDDPEAEVRSAAAVALGEVGAQGVMDTVMLAALRGVPEAAILFGTQASAQDVARFLRRLDATTLEASAPALRILLERANVQRPTKLAIVQRLAALEGALSARVLREVGATLPENDPVRRAIDQALATEDAAAAEVSQ
ncbi:HEAT repeat domain-containing protein [Sandaracinus amylolyticus]|uniref:HEAT repeat domain-containing protein n=1 Tax=Sandaracinus amylolyticus TaxID=927083 RepID=UPI001F41E7DB|nr:HEAT repeat domain-containing protein [Sandaracinus amylolyticus]UJR82332.1 Hypothetical protein I5071_43970 [Sandaracinus amylolyticus]